MFAIHDFIVYIHKSWEIPNLLCIPYQKSINFGNDNEPSLSPEATAAHNQKCYMQIHTVWFPE